MITDPNAKTAEGTIPPAVTAQGTGTNPPQKVDVSGTQDNQPVEPPKAPAADDLGFTESQKEYIKSLREENAKHRVKAKESQTELEALTARFTQLETGLKGLFGEGEKELSPEEKVQALTQNNEQLQIQTALLELAHEHSIPKDGMEYFEFLLGKQVDALPEGEELSEEALLEIVTKAKGQVGNSATSVTGATAGTANIPAPIAPGKGQLTVEDFAKMNMGEKSNLYQNNPEIYKMLVHAAKQEGKLI